MAMSARREKFVEEYLISGNAKDAYIKAGYKVSGHSAESGAHQLMRNIEIKKAIEERRAKIAAKADLTIEMILAGLRREAENTGEGSSASARVRAWELLGRAIGVKFTDHTEASVKARLEVVEEIVDGVENNANQENSSPT